MAVIEAVISRIDAKLDLLQAGQDRLREDVSELKGVVKNLPTTWQMITGIIGGNIALAGALVAAAVAAARVMGHN